MHLAPTRAAAQTLIETFLDRAGRPYAETRNHDHGPANRINTSMLSRYLRYHLVTEDEVLAAVHAHHPSGAAAKFIDEVLWRSYWKGWLELRPAIWSEYTHDLATMQAHPGGWQRDHARALAANTGIDCFDAWVAELAEHNYLHNHARMWFASIWIFTLRLPWQLGAALFWHHLHDGDPASNTLSWRWVAGLQTAGKTYLATADNIARHTNGRFNPKGLATRPLPVQAPPPPAPRALPPTPPIPAGPVGLLIAEDDLSPETLPLARAEVTAIATLDTPFGRAAPVEAFVAAARTDARTRAAAAFDAPAFDAPATSLPTPEAVQAWANAHNLKHLVIAYPPTGPSAEMLTTLTATLASQGLHLTPIRRDWDTTTWPHALKGFFAFRKACNVT